MRFSRDRSCTGLSTAVTTLSLLVLLAGWSGEALAIAPRADQQPSVPEAASAKCTIASDNPDVKAFMQEAERLFTEEIFPRWRDSDNVWRNAWAMDSILDYFAACGIDVSLYGETILSVLDPSKQADWWDDFGWMGIAALRAAEQGTAGKYRDDLLKIAINSWAYMYGPGWSTDKNTKAIVPFTDVALPGWFEFACRHSNNIGAPNAWQQIDKTWNSKNKPLDQGMKMERRPRFSPGGVWNAPITDEIQPSLQKEYAGWASYLNPAQNTVTNGLYAILTLRLYQASQNPSFKAVFDASKLDAPGCLQAWKEQILWFDQWTADNLDPGQSLLLSPPNGGILFRERVSTFHEWSGTMYWDAAFRKPLAWIGDQGLLFGALREGVQAAGHFAVEPNVLKRYPDILVGVFKNGYRDRTYGTDGSVTGSFLLPWLDTSNPDDPYDALSPGMDNNSYQTGDGVLMRYLLQAYKADQSLVSGYRDQIISSARNFTNRKFGPPADPSGACDAYTPYQGSDKVTEMTPYVNRLSVLLLASEMSK